MYLTLKGIGCTEAQINDHLQKPEVRLGLLDHADPGCGNPF